MDSSTDPSTNPSMDAYSAEAYDALNTKLALASIVRREICSTCKQSIVAGSRRLNAPNRHDCAGLAEKMQSYLLLYPCHRCGDVFTAMSNMGMWKCREHPGVYTNDGYTCCGRKRIECNNPAVHNGIWARRGIVEPIPFEPPGCTPCDHIHNDAPAWTQTAGSGIDVQRDLPDQIFALLEPLATDRPGWVVEDGKGLLRGRDLCPTEKKGGAL
jgi:hypothetical protein